MVVLASEADVCLHRPVSAPVKFSAELYGLEMIITDSPPHRVVTVVEVRDALHEQACWPCDPCLSNMRYLTHTLSAQVGLFYDCYLSMVKVCGAHPLSLFLFRIGPFIAASPVHVQASLDCIS